MSNNSGLSTVSELVKQKSLLNNRQYISAKDGLEFAETAIRTTRAAYALQQSKLDNLFSNQKLSKTDYDHQTNRLKHQIQIDCVPWEVYVKKLTQLIENYSSQSGKQQNHNKRTFNESQSMTVSHSSSSVSKRTRITFSSSSSDSDTPASIIPPIVTHQKPTSTVIKLDSSTLTDPLEFSLRSTFPSTPNIILFTAETNHVTQRIPLKHINEIAAKQIVLLHDEGQLVRWNDVVWRILTHFRVQDLGNLGVQRADQIACIDNLLRTQNKVNIYLDAYAYWQTMGTLNELENDLARIFYKNDYNELLLGPIEKQPKIEELFRLRHVRNEQIRKDLKSSDVLKYLDQYMTKEYVWKTENEINVDQFFKFIAQQLNVKNIHQLGIRMKSAYLARHCIKSMQANQRKTMEIARTELNQILTDVVQKEIEKISNIIHDKLDPTINNSTSQLRQMYASMDPIDIINDIIEICRDVCQSYPSFRKLQHALDIISKDPMLRNIFQIAICHGKLDLSNRSIQSKEVFNPNNSSTNKKIYFDSSDESDDDIEVINESCERSINPINDNQLLQAFKEQISSLKNITFTLLSRIEQRLCEKFKVKHFHELGHGTFSNYITLNEQLLFSVDTKFNLSSSECTNNNYATCRISFEDLEQFILQLLNRSVVDQQYIKQLICYHYHIESFEQLGHGSFRSVFDSIKHNKKQTNLSIHYECILVDEISLFKQRSNSTSQALTKDLEQQALLALDQSPLLGNLYVDTQWNLRFRSILGNLKVFLFRHKFPIFEIDHVTLLKLSSNSTLELFKESLYNYDVILTSGHLVTLLVQHGSLHNSPISLLSNIVQTFLMTISSDNRIYHFLIRIFLRIPFLLLSSVIERIFLQPLIKLEGSPMKIRELLWKNIDKQDSNMIIRFIQLGQYLGFTEWSIDKIKISIGSNVKIQHEKHVILPISNVQVSSSIIKIEKTFSTTNPYNFIECIRREKFGIGLNLSSESQNLTDQLKSLVGRSLERLSKELYNSDMHFVLELIQNADDNQYNSKPSLVFVIDSNSINIYNNEIGFQQDNIQALCDIGKSTKGKHKQGYIGQKGIGFKSVFTVCDRPEIYSNGYQICFDASNGSIGYILPNWIENENKDLEYMHWTTRICLPLKSENEMQKHKSRSLTESFNDIRPSLLLFLNRLRSITIHNRITNSKQSYERIDLPDTNIVEIRCEQMIEKWFIIKRQLQIPEDVKASFDDVIEATEIALAFPLHEIKNDDDILLIKQDVYAYLPLRTFGFTFIIQADFEVPSSRQDILSDSIWNQFLLNEIPSIFLSSLDAFHDEQSSLPIDPLRLFLCFLPNEISIYSNNLFTPVCRTILRLLRSRPFLPVINDNKLHLPNECVIINDPTIKEILTPELLYNHLHLYYLNDDLYKHEKQLIELGVHRLGHNELIDVIKHMFTTEINFENTKILSKWFCCLYRCLNELSLIDEENVLKHIQSLKIFPLKNHQEFISLNHIHQTIFFPSVNIQLPKLIENDLMIINEELWMNLKENSSEIHQIQSLLERLGIQCLTHRIICEQHIFPIFENDKLWKEKSSETLIAYVIYIFELWSKQNHFIDLSRFKSIVQIFTNDNFKQPINHSIYFTPEYGNRYDLSKDFNAYNWLLISDKYILENSSSNYRKKLRQFFSELGVSDFLFPINDSTYEPFDSLIKLQSISMNKKLFIALQETYSSFQNNELFIKHLKDSIWIPTSQIFYSYNDQTNSIDLNKIRKLDKPNQIYIRTKQIERLFGKHVPYIDVEIDSNSSFSNDLGLIEHITLNDVTSMLLNWSKNSIFYTSISHIQNIYEYIYENMTINELRELINHNSIIFIPVSTLSNRTDIISGRFVGISDVRWCDSTNLFAKYSSSCKIINHYLLETYYNEQKSIFLETFLIPLHPTIEEYINLLIEISSLKKTDTTIQDVFLIFKTIGKSSEQLNNPIDKQELINKLSHKAIFPTKDHRWVSLDDNPLLSDNNDIAQLFTQMNHIPIIDIPSPDVLTFFNMCEIKSLSSSITIEPIIQNPLNGIFIQNLLSPLIPYIQLFMKSRPEFSDAYQWTKSINMSLQLANIQFNIVDHLQLIYRFKSNSSICTIREEKTYYDKNQMIFYIHHEWIEQSKYYRDIFHSFARIFLPYHNDELIRSLGNFMNLLYNEEENNLEIFAKYQNFDLTFKDLNDSPWQIPSTSKHIKNSEPEIDENKVRMLLDNVAQNQEQYNAYKQKRRQELKKQSSECSTTTNNQSTDFQDASDKANNSMTRLEVIRSDALSSLINNPYENVEQHTKHVNVEDLTHQVLDNRDSAIGSDKESLEKIGRWGEHWVNEYLRAKYCEKIQSKEIEIFWLNEILEQGKPYDFVLKNLKSQIITYIEVKSTLSNNRQLIPITYNELQYCCSLSDVNHQYQIYRIYNTGRLKNVKLRIVENIEEKLRKHDMIICYRRLLFALTRPKTQSFLMNTASYRINPIETKNQITVPHSMIKNVERQRAKKIYRKEQEQDPPGDRTQTPIVACKRSEFNHYPGREYRQLTEKHVASSAWQHRLSKGDFFTIDHHFKNPSWSQSTAKTFGELGCKPEIVEILKKANIHNPTSTQSRIIPQLRSGRHMIVTAETGGGKTLAYLIPLIESLIHAKSNKQIVQADNAPFAIILAPTRELVVQIESMLQVFKELNVRTKGLIGINTDKDPLNFTLGEVDIIIATPGVLLRLLRQDEHFGIQRRLIGSNLRHVIVDEADTLLDITFSPAVVEIIRRLEVDVQPINNLDRNAPPAVQLVFVSATIPTTTEESLKELISADQIDKMSTPSVHRIMPHVPQKFYRIGSQQKLGLLLKLVKYDIEKKHPCLIFCNETKTVKFLQQFFRDQRIEILVMHSHMTDSKRTQSLKEFQNGENKIMCATDIISRGVDTYWVEHVIQYDFPRFISDYIHRTGRVGRIGSKNPGKVSSFVTQSHEINLAQKIEVTARMNKKLNGVNNDIKTQLDLHAKQRELKQEKIEERRAREELCKEVIRSAMV